MIDPPIIKTAPAKADLLISRKPARPSRLFDGLVFAIPCLLFLEIQLVGRLFVSELLLLALTPILLLYKGRLLAAPMPRTLLMLGLLWLLSQVATDLIRNTPFEDYSRGWAKITLTLINFAALYMLLHNNRRRLVLFAIGMVVGGFLQYQLISDAYTNSAAGTWKFGLAQPVTLLLVLCGMWAFKRHGPRFVSLFLIFAAVLNLVNGFRGLAGVCFVTAIFLFIQWRRSRPGGRISQRRIVLISLIGVVGAIGFFEFYEYAAREGMLGRESQQKYNIQSKNKYGVLIGGRKEIMVSIQAISDSPIIGHGSWAKDAEYAAMLHQLSEYNAQQRTMMRILNPGLGLIPTHSFIFGAWVEAGIIGAVFWAYVLWITARNLVFLNQMKEILTPLIAYFSFLMFWDIVFSPFGAQRRVLVPFFIILVMFCWDVVLAHRRARMAGVALT